MSARGKQSTERRVQGRAEGNAPDRKSSPAASATARRRPQSTKRSRKLEESSRSPEPSGSDFASPKGMNARFTPEELRLLKRMLREYKDTGMDFSVLPRRPRFKRPRVNSGISINAEIRRRALERAQDDPDGTGGSLSALIEHLLWIYIGRPADVVERFPR